MTTKTKGRNGGNRATLKLADTLNHTQITSSIGWRGAMALGSGKFRINSTYDSVAPARTIQRRIERRLAKERTRR